MLINVKAGTASFFSDLTRVKNLSFDTAQQTARSMSVIGAAAMGMVGVFLAGTIAAIDKTVAFETHILHLAQSAGTTTETMSGLAFAAKMVGMNVDEVGLAMERFDKKLQGIGTNKATADLMKSFGIDKASLQTSDQALMKLADRFSTMPDGIQKSGIAMQFFGKAGAAMIPVLNLGSAGIEEFKKQAADMGLVVSKASAEAAEKFEQNAIRLKGYLQGLMRSFADFAVSIANSIHDAFTMKGGFALTGAALADLDPEEQARQTADLTKAVEAHQVAINKAAKAVHDMLIPDAEAEAAKKKLAEAIKSVTDKLTEQIGTFGMNTRSIEIYKLAVKGASDQDLEHVMGLQKKLAQLQFVQEVQKQYADMLSKLDLQEKQRIETLDHMGARVTALVDGFDLLNKTAKEPDFMAHLAAMPSVFAGVDEEVNALIKDLQTQQRNIGLTADQYVLLGLAAKGASETQLAAIGAEQAGLLNLQLSLQTFKDRWKEMGDVANRALDDLIFSGKSFTAVIQDITKQLGELFLRWALFGNGKSGSGGGLFGMLETTIQGLLGIGGGAPDVSTGFGGAATGGPASAGVPILVGEQGPEIFTPSTSGTIIPNSAMAPMMRSSGGSAGGVTMIYNIDARGADAGAEARIRKALQDTENNAVARALLMVRDTQLRTA